jgi:hypothetical protein
MATSPFPSNEHPDEVIDRLCRELTSDDNVIVVRNVKDAFRVWLAGHPEILISQTRDVAGAMVGRFIRRRLPRPGAAQLGLFRPEALVSVGDGKRAWMDLLSRDQFTLWRDSETTAFTSTQSVYQAKTDYWDERIAAWGSRSTLGQVEREVFFWTDDQIVDDDDGDDD